ncbi:hypothetical protein FRC12_021111 [Ceratobasidium sp. 428]|nr:hypothetical protein FRC12_021111 [Ceratobasidium sp. 428]
MTFRKTRLSSTRKKERDEFIGSSLAPSRLVSERILSWSGSNDRGRLFVMRFHSERQHSDCPVMGWYNDQRKSSTKFRSIEHRQHLDIPFYHEFLLLKLADGAICRVERTGEGSHADAIRSIGCIANDIIQWFSEVDYEAFSANLAPSERITEVNLGQEFDILDILAICYSIQHTQACRAYTLQRYNCYFLCLTVLAVLTRRVASWETNIDATQWDSRLDSMLKDLSNLPHEESRKYTILALCAYLEPENPRRAQFIFDILQEHLRSRAEGFTQCNDVLKCMLWQAGWEPVLRSTLIEPIKVISDTLQDSGYCSQQFKRGIAISDADSMSAIASSKIIARHGLPILAEEIANFFDRGKNTYKSLMWMWQIEHPVSFGNFVLSRLAGNLGASVLALVPVSLLADAASDSTMQLILQLPIKPGLMKFARTGISASTLDRLEGSDAMRKLMNKAFDQAEEEFGGLAAVQLLDGLALKGVLGPSEVSLVVTCFVAQSSFAENVAALAASGLKSILRAILEERRINIRLTPSPQGMQESDKVFMTIGDFQESYIKPRIADHARRVDTHLLAAAEFVIEDIEKTMQEVWQGLPLGFGIGVAGPTTVLG